MSERSWRRGLAVFIIADLIALLVVGLTVGNSSSKSTTVSQPATSASPSASPSGAPWDWRTIHYDKFKGTPRGYFGPKSPCIKSGLSVEKCKNDLKEALKHDPLELSVWMEQFNLLPGQKDGMSASELETLRKAYAAKLEDWHLRKQEQPRVAAVIDSLRNVRIIHLSGPYYSTYTDGKGNVLPIRKVMYPSKNIALVGTMADGTKIEDKLDCHHQPVSKKPLTPTPKKRTPKRKCPPGTHPSPLKPKVCIQPKNPKQDVLVNPSVPPQVRGPGTTPVGQDPGPATTPTDSSTGCNGPCPGHSPQPTPSDSPTAPATTPSPVATQPPQDSPVPTPPPPSS